jgi:segregation and condensation protein B
MKLETLKNIIEAVLLSAEHPMSVAQLGDLFMGDNDCPTRDDIRQALHELGNDYASRGLELQQVASGFRMQVKQDYAPWVGRLWEEKPARYTRALLETIALIAYRQPITRGEIEEIRGVSVSSNIVRTLIERDWVKVLGHKDVPGKPSLYGTTREFLDYFNLKSLDELPTLAEIRDVDKIHPELALDAHTYTETDAEAEAEALQRAENAQLATTDCGEHDSAAPAVKASGGDDTDAADDGMDDDDVDDVDMDDVDMDYEEPGYDDPDYEDVEDESDTEVSAESSGAR